MSKLVVIATKNDKKLHELKRYLRPLKANVTSLKSFGNTPYILENGVTFKANAVKKAVTISRFVKGVALADDSGLKVDALGGRPGVRSARFAGRGKKDADNIKKLLKILKGVPYRKRRARFVCSVAIADNGKLIKTIDKDCGGIIAFAARGSYGFGYDPVFLIPKHGKTFGELGPKVKDAMSHRAKALKEARRFLRKYLSARS
jgi:XTP/dITP diphosphohydrolase